VIDAKGGNDTVSPKGGPDVVTLGDGADTLRGSLADLAGDRVTDFDPHQDHVAFDDPHFDFSNIKGITFDANGVNIFFGSPGDITNGIASGPCERNSEQVKVPRRVI
jgi:Ca2+-binding RTX toxin-like protein